MGSGDLPSVSSRECCGSPGLEPSSTPEAHQPIRRPSYISSSQTFLRRRSVDQVWLAKPEPLLIYRILVDSREKLDSNLPLSSLPHRKPDRSLKLWMSFLWKPACLPKEAKPEDISLDSPNSSQGRARKPSQGLKLTSQKLDAAAAELPAESTVSGPNRFPLSQRICQNLI